MKRQEAKKLLTDANRNIGKALQHSVGFEAAHLPKRRDCRSITQLFHTQKPIVHGAFSLVPILQQRHHLFHDLDMVEPKTGGRLGHPRPNHAAMTTPAEGKTTEHHRQARSENMRWTRLRAPRADLSTTAKSEAGASQDTII